LEWLVQNLRWRFRFCLQNALDESARNRLYAVHKLPPFSFLETALPQSSNPVTPTKFGFGKQFPKPFLCFLRRKFWGLPDWFLPALTLFGYCIIGCTIVGSTVVGCAVIFGSCVRYSIFIAIIIALVVTIIISFIVSGFVACRIACFISAFISDFGLSSAQSLSSNQTITKKNILGKNGMPLRKRITAPNPKKGKQNCLMLTTANCFLA